MTTEPIYLVEEFEKSQEAFNKNIVETFHYIQQTVMKESGITEKEALMPMGLRFHLERLAGFRPDNATTFEESIKDMDPEALRRQLYFFNLLATLDAVDRNLKVGGGYVGKVDRLKALLGHKADLQYMG